jgi:alpha-L-fucosidase
LPAPATFKIPRAGKDVDMGVNHAYQPTWESLNSRLTPQWFLDAKFAVFVMWGEYSVPAWADKSFYSEWYEFLLKTSEGQDLNDRELSSHNYPKSNDPFLAASYEGRKKMFQRAKEIGRFHEKVYGKSFPFENFLAQFKGELFDPVHWADVFARAGVKYVVMSAKHHGGYCLFPSMHEAESWGYPKDSVHLGPRRDVLGETLDAMRQKNLRAGMYYSLYEWQNPLWIADRNRYVEKLFHPQFKELITRYEPSIIWADGDWLMDDKGWRSEELLAWLFNESPVRDDVVVNDRWGALRRKHGTYFTTEFGSGLPDGSHPWEESRGIDNSYAYNRNSSLAEYRSVETLVHTLIDTVSRGGNLILNVGPMADGMIPLIVEDRLLGIGAWLRVNGEAIYETRPWERSCQWSDGPIPHRDFSKTHSSDLYDLSQLLTKDPTRATAIIEAFFTKKEGTLYVLIPRWPGKRFVLKNIKLAERVTVTLLGYGAKLSWRPSQKDVVIDIPQLSVDEVPCRWAYVLKIEGCA